MKRTCEGVFERVRGSGFWWVRSRDHKGCTPVFRSRRQSSCESVLASFAPVGTSPEAPSGSVGRAITDK